MRSQIILLVLVLCSLAAKAQDTLAVVPMASLPAGAAPDSVAAVRQLFAAKRKTRQYVVGGTALAGVTGMVVALNQPAPPHSVGFGAGIDGRPIMATLIGVATGAIVGIELFVPSIWSSKREEQAVAALAAHQLPRYVKRRLQPTYFHTAGDALTRQ
ncbi:hypothetical protein [Hymenobacter negativus]|uniref:Uncharacterized protein n=1 Tax=Hymenobacter negativus TaxID=2795026 RepID=A0ABS3QC98_9BACT|nr:hypothetical protein [Hymenobacter negativus]MBO2008870.1 hypothetical protein [Hymenobacter negativus]